MTIKEELYQIIDDMEEEQAKEALTLLRRFTSQPNIRNGGKAAFWGNDRSPIIVSGKDFFTAKPKSIKELAEEQGVKPIRDIADLVADFWPEDESVDEFIATIRAWRHERDV